MAGKRLSDNTAVDANNPLLSNDKFVVANSTEDRIISFAELTRILHEGVDGISSVQFASNSELGAITNPSAGKYKISGGKIYYFNDDDSGWYELKVIGTNGKTLTWGAYRAVSVDSTGAIASPANFIAANNIVTVGGGKLAKLKAGSGLIGQDYNGDVERTLSIDTNLIDARIALAISAALSTARPQIKMSVDGQTVQFTVQIKNGVPTLKGEIINE